MDNANVVKIVNRIETDFRELAEVTGEDHISAFIIKGNFCLMSFDKNNGQGALDIYREGGKTNGKN